MGTLKLRIEADDDGTAELFAFVEANGFAGRGSAWVDLLDLQTKASEFGRYPLDSSALPCIEGGYWKKDCASEIEQEHLHISAYPINLRGGIGVRVRIATPYQHEDELRSRHSASVELKVTYAQLSLFSEGLTELAKGKLTEVVLEEEPI